MFALSRRKRFVAKLLAALLLAGLVTIVWINREVTATGPWATSVWSAPTSTTALVFGGGLEEDGTQSEFQADRVTVGIQLYQAHKVQKIMFTGDDGARWGSEVQAMKLAALKAGVPSKDILIDPHGYRTYDSCWRAKNVYHLDNQGSIIAVSQNFHLPRIFYLCRNMGLPVTGVSADIQDYSYHYYGGDYLKANAREVLARVKVWLDFLILHPEVSTTTN